MSRGQTAFSGEPVCQILDDGERSQNLHLPIDQRRHLAGWRPGRDFRAPVGAVDRIIERDQDFLERDSQFASSEHGRSDQGRMTLVADQELHDIEPFRCRRATDGPWQSAHGDETRICVMPDISRPDASHQFLALGVD